MQLREKHVTIREMKLSDVELVLPLYLDYYNTCEECSWTMETAGCCIRQIVGMQDAYSLLMQEEDGTPIGFAMGYFKQYDDLVGYELEEIVIARKYQRQGLGSKLLACLEERVRQKGASCVELKAVKDEMHEQYYGKAGYQNVGNFILKVKWLE